MKHKAARLVVSCCLLALLCSARLALAQPREIQTAVRVYDFPGAYEKEAAQGFAIFGDAAFLLNNGGRCRIYDLSSKKTYPVTQFDLASADGANHCNSASFGVEFPKGNTLFPALYISECYGKNRCFVESITPNGPKLIQTIGGVSHFDWVVDREQKALYGLSGASGGGVRVHKYPLPPLPPAGKSRVNFTKEDVIEQFTINFPNLTQGAAIRNGKLYLPVGLHDVAEGTPEWRSREIIVVDLKTRKIEKKIDINASCPHEPEDCDFYGDVMLLYCGQRGGLWRIPGA